MNSTNPILGAKPFFGDHIEDILADINAVLLSGELAHGSCIEKFEQEFSKISKTKHAIAVSSGGTALELILKALDIKGKEVIVPTDTFVATANSVILAGGIPVFADISEKTLALNLDTIKHLVTDNTAAIIIVHMFGLIPNDIFELKLFCENKGILLIEDAAHAHGASLNGQTAGSIGIASAFSFYPTKIMTTGEGGIVTTNDDSIADKIKILRNHGKSLKDPIFIEVSNNYRLSEIPAILGYYQCKLLESNLKIRKEIAQHYREAFKNLKYLDLLPKEEDQESNVFWRFPILLDQKVDRIKMQKFAERNYGVRITWMYEPLCHRQPVFMKYCNTNTIELPIAENCMSRLICLPCYPNLTSKECDIVIKSIIDFESIA
jgi:dTDP-4-amino-4,6-dideoxygalactose transaminase